MSVSRLAGERRPGWQMGRRWAPFSPGGPPAVAEAAVNVGGGRPPSFPRRRQGLPVSHTGSWRPGRRGSPGPVSQDGSLEPRPPALARLQGLQGAQKRPRASSPCASASTRERLGPVSGDVAAVALAVTAAVAVARLCSGATEAVAEKVGLGRRGRSR